LTWHYMLFKSRWIRFSRNKR